MGKKIKFDRLVYSSAVQFGTDRDVSEAQTASIPTAEKYDS